MFKAIRPETGEEILILHPRWRENLDELRRLDRCGQLVCQGCRQQVRVKSGKVYRPHFAHKHLKACSYGSESPGVLMARAALYHWLVRHFGVDQVTVEHPLQGLPRPVDCWVKTGSGSLAYWVVDAGIKLEPRISILQALRGEAISAVFVFTHQMLHPANSSRIIGKPREQTTSPEQAQRRLIELGQKGRLKKPGRLEMAASGKGVLLSPTERDLARLTPFDERPGESPVEQDRWGSLYYLDPASEVLLAYRGLVRVHKPNWFEGTPHQAALAEWQVNRETGDFCFPGEIRRLALMRRSRDHLVNKKQGYERHLKNSASPRVAIPSDEPEPPVDRNAVSPEVSPPEPQPPTQRWTLPARDRQIEPLPCVTCGQITTDYWATFFMGDRKLCRCRDCLRRE